VAKQIEFHKAAASELEAAFDWYFGKNEEVAARFLREIDHALESIAAAPDRGQSAGEMLANSSFAVLPSSSFIVSSLP